MRNELRIKSCCRSDKKDDKGERGEKPIVLGNSW